LDTENEHVDGVWVNSGVAKDGSYLAFVEFTPEIRLPLDRSSAARYVMAVVTQAMHAEHDAAVTAQLTKKLGLPIEAAVEVVGSLRADRPSVDQAATAPLILTPGVSGKTLGPFLAGEVTGSDLRWQWTPADAREHAMYVLAVAVAVELDAAYYRYLVESLDLEDTLARAVVHDLGNWLEDDEK
jgi:hypothetical protein